MKLTCHLLCIALTAAASGAPSTLFYDDFGDNLSQWTGKDYGPHHGIIVDDPLRPGNRVLSFDALNNGGDMFSVPGLALEPGAVYQLSLEYRGLPASASEPDDCGGFVGLSHHVDDPFFDGAWIFGTRGSYPGLRDHLVDDGQWRMYSYEFVWEPSEFGSSENITHVMLEDWLASGPYIGDVYFDNVSLMQVPEPGIISMFVLAGCTCLWRTKTN